MMIHPDPYNLKSAKNGNVLDFFSFFLYSPKLGCLFFSLIQREGTPHHPSIALELNGFIILLFHWVFGVSCPPILAGYITLQKLYTSQFHTRYYAGNKISAFVYNINYFF